MDAPRICAVTVALVVDIVTEFFVDVMLSELLYADGIVLMSEAIQELRDKFLKLKEACESEGLKVILGKPKVSCSITKNGLSKSKVDPCGVCSLGVKASSVLCLQCGEWIHGRCAGVKGVAPQFCE